MNAIIACNLSSYRQYQDSAYEHLSEIGLTNVEISCPEPEKVDSVKAELDEYGLVATSVIVPCQMDSDDVVMRFAWYLDTVSKLGVRYVFTSAKSGEIDRDYVYGRLQGIGDAAAERGITVGLETHPDLVTNGDVGLDTMRGVIHPNVRINFDTGNVFYYNRDVTSEGELAKIADYVAMVHLKDTDGGFESWYFPALGEGVVNFPAVFEMLSGRGFTGPFTMELEGVRGEEVSRADVESRVEKSLAYLRTQGLCD